MKRREIVVISHNWGKLYHFATMRQFRLAKIIITFCCFLFLFACNKHEDLYERVGFEAGRRPYQLPEHNSRNNSERFREPMNQAPRAMSPQVAPDYYYRQPVYSYPPASRHYNNPYAFPSRQYPYYDVDHYYTPPASSGYGVEGKYEDEQP